VARWQKNSDFFRLAPVCIAVFMSRYSSVADQILRARGEADPVAKEIRSFRQIGNSSLQSIAAVVAYLLLILHNFGLATTYMAGPQQAKKEIEQILGVGPDWNFVALIPVGYPGETPKAMTRKPITEVSRFIR
jgi:nitroreductase